MENEEVLQETENPEVEPTLEVQEVEEKSEAEIKAEEIARNQRIRAEKAEKELKALKAQAQKVTEPKSELSVSVKDAKALLDVPDEDVDEVVEFAKFKGISIAEAKKSSVMQAVLKTRAEERATAQATNTTVARKVKKETGDDVLEKFEKGQEVDTDALVQAQIERRKQLAKR